MREDLRPGVSPLEWSVLRAAWASEGEVSVAGLKLKLEEAWDDESLERMVNRLVEKGYLRPRPGHAVIPRYSAAQAPLEVLRADALRWCAERSLSREEIAALARELLDAATKHKTAKGRPAR